MEALIAMMVVAGSWYGIVRLAQWDTNKTSRMKRTFLSDMSSSRQRMLIDQHERNSDVMGGM